MPARKIDLTDHFDSFISSAIDAGRYSDVSEAVQAALRLLEQQEKEDEAKLERLRAIAKDAFDALDRGEGIQLESIDNIEDFVNEAVAEARLQRSTQHA